MKKALVPALLALSTQVLAAPPVIYGDDNRIEIYEASPELQKLAASAASMVKSTEITAGSIPGTSNLTQRTLRDWLSKPAQEGIAPIMSKMIQEEAPPVEEASMSFCPAERFIDQPNPAMCSGFLIAPDLLVTAGHCVAIENFCADYKWVFDFKMDPQSHTAGLNVKNENIYSCKRVISGALNMNLGLDFGVVQLDRDVTGREPLKIRSENYISEKAEVLVIGGPSGLPLKIAAGAAVRTSTHPFFFKANLDTFQGNSGSGVFNAKTGVVEGILVRGEDDFEVNPLKMCVQAKKCTNEGCRGEDVSRMTSIPEVAVNAALRQAAKTGDVSLLNSVLELGTWVDFYGADKVTALMVAAANEKVDAIKGLIAGSANVSLSDIEGNTALHYLAKSLTDEVSPGLDALLSGKAPLEARNKLGETPVLVAAKALNLAAVKLLVKAGADKSVVDLKGDGIADGFLTAGDENALRELSAIGISPAKK